MEANGQGQEKPSFDIEINTGVASVQCAAAEALHLSTLVEKYVATQERVSTNPFGSDSDDSKDEGERNKLEDISHSDKSFKGPPKNPTTPPVGKSFNPFGSDFEDEEEGSNVTAINVLLSSHLCQKKSLSTNDVTITMRPPPPSPVLSTGSRRSRISGVKLAGKKKQLAPPPPLSNIEPSPSSTVGMSITPTPSPRTSKKHPSSSPTPTPRMSKTPMASKD